MKRSVVLLLVLLLLLLGVQRTPEANLGAVVGLSAAAVGGCVYLAASTKPDVGMPSQTETPATP